MLRLPRTAEFSDLAINAGGQDCRVYKAIIHAHSPVIKAALTSGFKVSRIDL
jgi:hypothetical protein